MNRNREKALKDVQKYNFAVNEAVLYLDGHPTNKNALEFYMKAKKMHKDAKEKYEATYGPLTFYNAQGPSGTWIKGPWPWQNEREA